MFLLKRHSLYLALAGAVMIVMLVMRSQSAPPAAVPSVPPARSPFGSSLAAVGLVEAERENVRVATPLAGVVARMFVTVGQDVKQGQPLFQIDARDLEKILAQREADLRRIDANIAEMEVLLADRKSQFERQTKLKANSVISADDLERISFALKSAEARIATARAERGVAGAALDAAKTTLDRLTVRAPRDGRVLQVNVREGEFAALDPRETLLVIGDVARLQIRAEVDEQNAPKVRPGSDAVAFLKGSTERPIPLKFSRIEPFVVPKRALSGESTERVDTRVLQVIYTFDLPPFPVYVGQQVDVFIQE